MIRNFLLIIIIFFFYEAKANNKEQIILKFKDIKNFNFDFEQNINGKIEEGNCTVKYPKKIYCKYNASNNKILVSNGKSLVIKNRNSGTYYIYPLKKTPLELLLNKDYLISKMIALKPRDIDNKYLNFNIIENNNKINVFFDKKTLNLVGWQTEDIYQNLSITFISSVRINEDIDDNLFVLPKKD